MAEARGLMNELRPGVLDDHGLIAAIDRLVCERRGRTTASIEWSYRGDFDRLASPLETALYRIVQEGLTNALRHSDSERVRIALSRQDQRIRVAIEDWGCGFDLREVAEDRFGVQGICRRAKLFGGQVTIDSDPGRGTRIAVDLPLVET
jgi:signal transduction histidine kinase